MPHAFVPARIYRQPISFGPSLSPRQRPEGGGWGNDPSSHENRSIWVTFRSNPEQLEGLLPPDFELERPLVTVAATTMKNINWLAGRGYNTLGVRIPARYCGKRDQVSGSFLAVLWENMADPIITGREELGFPKVYGELPDVVVSGDGKRAHSAGLWDGFKFMDIEVSDLVEQPVSQAPEPSPPGLMYKYQPRTGEWGAQPEVAYATLNPAAQPGAPAPRQVLRQWTGSGRVAFYRATFQQLPTLMNIVNGLADLEVGDVVGAGMQDTLGASDISSQRALC
jgi:hypothetical protein